VTIMENLLIPGLFCIIRAHLLYLKKILNLHEQVLFFPTNEEFPVSDFNNGLGGLFLITE